MVHNYDDNEQGPGVVHADPDMAAGLTWIPSTILSDPSVSDTASYSYILLHYLMDMGKRLNMAEMARYQGCTAGQIRRNVDELIEAGYMTACLDEEGTRTGVIVNARPKKGKRS